jgi:putative transposase
LAIRNIQQSYDNTPMESFWARIKTELGHPLLFEDFQQATNAIYDYVHIFYNRQRMHSAIRYMSPVKFEEQFFFTQREYLPCQH